jgi:hypothetical protein
MCRYVVVYTFRVLDHLAGAYLISCYLLPYDNLCFITPVLIHKNSEPVVEATE